MVGLSIVEKLLNLPNMGGVDDDVAAVFPEDGPVRRKPTICQSAENENVRVQVLKKLCKAL